IQYLFLAEKTLIQLFIDKGLRIDLNAMTKLLSQFHMSAGDILDFYCKQPSFDINSQDKNGDTLLHYLVKSNNSEAAYLCCQLLEDHQNSIALTIPNQKGESVLDILCVALRKQSYSSHDKTIVKLLELLPLNTLVLSNGVHLLCQIDLGKVSSSLKEAFILS